MQPPKRTFSLRGPAGSRSTRAAAAEGATVDEVSAVSRADAEGCFRFRDLLEGMSEGSGEAVGRSEEARSRRWITLFCEARRREIRIPCSGEDIYLYE